MKALVFFLLFLPVCASAQTVITGKVINTADNKPVSYASVFLSNTVVGTRSNDDGSFTLQNVKRGQYDLVVSFIGFETHHQTVTISNASIAVGDITITPKVNELKEVHIGAPDPNRARWLEMFKHDFIGTSVNAQQCKITNPDVIDIAFDKQTAMLTASTDDFLIIENKALGYKVHYQVSKFVRDNNRHFLYYEGSVLFENMDGSPSEQRRWAKNRLNVYLGSDMHFLRSIFDNQLEQEGFKVLKLIRKTNTVRPPEELIRTKLRMFGLGIADNPKLKDSVDYWSGKAQLPRVIEYLVTTPLNTNDFVEHTDVKDMLALSYTDYLYVMYTKKHTKLGDVHVYHPTDMPDYATTVVALNQKYAVFDRNGIFINPSSTTYEGAWGQNAVAELLPVDYMPVP